jgi:hypothetical protein
MFFFAAERRIMAVVFKVSAVDNCQEWGHLEYGEEFLDVATSTLEVQAICWLSYKRG